MTMHLTQEASRPVIFWFRQDLRLSDHPALLEAIAAGPLLPVYILDPAAGTPWQAGAASRWWLYYSLQALDQSLHLRGSRLIIRAGDSERELRRLLRESKASRIFASRLYEPPLAERDQRLTKRLPLELRQGNLLQEPWQLQTRTGGPYKVFTPYWKACLARLAPPETCDAPLQLPEVAQKLRSEPLSELGLLPKIPWDTQMLKYWQIGEAAAQERLRQWLAGDLAGYAAARDFPGLPGTSGLSPHLHFGEISPRQIWRGLLSSEAFSQPESAQHCRVFLTEIGWREFAYHILHHFPQTPEQPLNSRFEAFPWQIDAQWLKAWQRGQTGYPIVDAGMRELWAHGWMHNRVRMIVASFLTKDLLLPWQEGAKWFWDTLVDADLASNSFNWQWAAGCGADASPFFRIFNPVTQGQKYDPQGEYVRRWVPELADLPDKWLHKPWEAPKEVLLQARLVLGKNYPLPLVDHAQARNQALMAFEGIRQK